MPVSRRTHRRCSPTSDQRCKKTLNSCLFITSSEQADPHRHRRTRRACPDRADRARSRQRSRHLRQAEPKTWIRPGGLDRHGGRFHARQGQRAGERPLAPRGLAALPARGRGMGYHRCRRFGFHRVRCMLDGLTGLRVARSCYLRRLKAMRNVLGDCSPVVSFKRHEGSNPLRQ